MWGPVLGIQRGRFDHGCTRAKTFAGSDEMKNACESWKDQLLEAALTGSLTAGLEEHLRTCTICSEELDNVRVAGRSWTHCLPLVAQGSEPSANFRARVLAAAEAAREGKRARPWRVWTLAGATAVVVAVLMIA